MSEKLGNNNTEQPTKPTGWENIADYTSEAIEASGQTSAGYDDGREHNVERAHMMANAGNIDETHFVEAKNFAKRMAEDQMNEDHEDYRAATREAANGVVSVASKSAQEAFGGNTTPQTMIKIAKEFADKADSSEDDAGRAYDTAQDAYYDASSLKR